MGASWIHGVRGNPLTDLADELDIKRATTDYGNHIVRDAQGRIVDEDDLPEDFEVVTSIEHEYAADHAELSPRPTMRAMSSAAAMYFSPADTQR